MKQQIRRGVFETNSSSTHSLTIFRTEDWKKFKEGKMAIETSYYEPRLVPRESLTNKDIYTGEKDTCPFDYDYLDYDSFCKNLEVIVKDVEDYTAVSIHRTDY